MPNPTPIPSFIQERVSLKAYNTFRFEAQARFFSVIQSVDELIEALEWAKNNLVSTIMLGEGSNLLIADNLDTLVLINRLQGLSVVEQTDSYLMTVAGGENWHKTVSYAVSNNLGGLENLALIPGTVGASPVQNIGAYGVEVKDCIDAVEVIDRETLVTSWIDSQHCGFGYRDSYFKQKWASKYFIISVRFRLSKTHSIKTEYAGLKQLLSDSPTIKDIFDAVCKTRSDKLPDPSLIGNAGSFFKNPIIKQSQYEVLVKKIPNVVAFSLAGEWKLAAGWLIDQAGWKGFSENGVGVYEKQALCLVNHSSNSGHDLLTLEEKIKEDIFNKFGVQLEREPILLPN